MSNSASPSTESTSTLKGLWLLMRMDKPVGIYLLLWPTLWALWLASLGMPEVDVLVIFVLGVVVMRA
ncbi:MAG: 4-hydroxybenzoate octaprenyltransferase, partial [Glaciecola sp.]